jgi:hypothetical protein
MLASLRALLRPKSAEASPDTADYRAEYVAAATSRGQGVVFLDWVGVWTVSAVGAVYFAERTDLADRAEVTDPREVHIARFKAAERYVDLAHLRPVRGPNDPTCPHCAGTGRIALPGGVEDRGNIWCWCGGLGWLPAGTPLAPEHDAS